MRSYIEDDRFVVAIGHQEACRLNTGAIIGDRRNPLWSEAKVEVHPYRDYDFAYVPVESFSSPEYLKRLHQIRCVVMFFENLDLEVYVPPEVSRHALIAAEHIERASVVTIVHGDERMALLGSLPVNGVTIRFDYNE